MIDKSTYLARDLHFITKNNLQIRIKNTDITVQEVEGLEEFNHWVDNATNRELGLVSDAQLDLSGITFEGKVEGKKVRTYTGSLVSLKIDDQEVDFLEALKDEPIPFTITSTEDALDKLIDKDKVLKQAKIKAFEDLVSDLLDQFDTAYVIDDKILNFIKERKEEILAYYEVIK